MHGASKAKLIDGRPGSPSDLCSTDSHGLRRKCGARYKMCSTAQPASTVLEGSTCHSSYEGPRSGSSRSDHTGNPGVASVTEDPPSIRCEHATPEDACRLARRQADSAHLACGRTRSGESGRQSVYNTGQIHARARMRRASPGSSRQMLDRSGDRAVSAQCGIRSLPQVSVDAFASTPSTAPSSVTGRRPSTSRLHCRRSLPSTSVYSVDGRQFSPQRRLRG